MSVFSLCVNARVSGWQLFWWNGTTTYPKTDLAHRSDQKNAPYLSKGPARPDFRSVPFSLAGFPGGGWHDLRILGVMPRLLVFILFLYFWLCPEFAMLRVLLLRMCLLTLLLLWLTGARATLVSYHIWNGAKLSLNSVSTDTEFTSCSHYGTHE